MTKENITGQEEMFDRSDEDRSDDDISEVE